MENQETIKSKVNALIYRKRQNSVLAHLCTWFHGNECHYFGNISCNKFQIWRFSKGTQGFYPVISGEITTNEQDDTTVILKAALNPLGYLQAILGAVGLILLTTFIIPEESSASVRFLIIIGIFLTLPIIVYFIFRYESKYHLGQLKDRLKVMIEQKPEVTPSGQATQTRPSTKMIVVWKRGKRDRLFVIMPPAEEITSGGTS